MLHQRYKDLFFLGIAKATLPNYWLRRWVYPIKAANGRARHLHLGCGPKSLPGFVNIDANPLHKVDMWLDIRHGLPFRDSSIESAYSTHMIEHFFPDELDRLFQECFRVLKVGGGLRLIVPSLSNAILAYRENRAEWFYDSFPRHFDSIGGRFANFVFCDGQHRTAFDFSYLAEVLHKAGFNEVEESAEGRSRLYGSDVPAFEPNDLERPHSLYVEAFKTNERSN
ncbi:MAG: class I SAM-dependent methyltransferase [Terriglobales bacterium]